MLALAGLFVSVGSQPVRLGTIAAHAEVWPNPMDQPDIGASDGLSLDSAGDAVPVAM